MCGEVWEGKGKGGHNFLCKVVFLGQFAFKYFKG